MTVSENDVRAAITTWRRAPVEPTPLSQRVQPGPWRFPSTLVLSLAAVCVLAGVAGLLIAHQGGLPHPRPRDVPVWAQAAGGAIVVVSVVVVTVATGWSWRSGGRRSNRRSPLWGALTWRERNRAIKQLSRRLPYEAEQVPMLRALASSTLNLAWSRYLALGAAGSQVGLALTRRGGPQTWIFLTAALCLLMTPIVLTHRAHAARAFLDQHPVR